MRSLRTPQGSFLAANNPLARDLAFAMVATEGAGAAHDRITGTAGTLTNTPLWRGGAGGVGAIDFPASGTAFLNFPIVTDTPFLGPLTIIWRGLIRTGSVYHPLADKHESWGGDNNAFEFRTGNQATPLLTAARANTTYRIFDGPAITVGALQTYGVVWSSGLLETVPTFSIDSSTATGTLQAGGATGACTGSGAPIRIGRRADGGIQLNGYCLCCYILSRACNVDEMRQIHTALAEDPLALLRPMRRIVPARLIPPGPINLTPSVGILALTGAPADLGRITPSVGTLALTGTAPAITTAILPSVGALALTSSAPSLLVLIAITPSVGVLALTGQATSLGTITPSVGTLTLSGVTPAITAEIILTPSAGSLALTEIQPSHFTSIQLATFISCAATASATLSTPLQLLIRWDVAAPLTASLPATWIVLNTPPLIASLPVTWDVTRFATGIIGQVPLLWTVIPLAFADPTGPPAISVIRNPVGHTDLIQRFTLQSNLELGADQFTADLAGSASYQDASAADRVTLKAGFWSGGQKYVLTLFTNGRVDDYYATIEPTKITGQIRGRDPMWLLQEEQIAVHFVAQNPPSIISGQADPSTLQLVGTWHASDIAQYIADRLGLILSWVGPDYEILDRFEAVGRAVDVLQRLVSPFSQQAATKMDLYTTGSVLNIHQRTVPLSLSPSPLFILNSDNVTRPVGTPGVVVKDLRLRKFETPKIGRVVLTGARKTTSVL